MTEIARKGAIVWRGNREKITATAKSNRSPKICQAAL